jgi:hypothetical protein
MRTAWRSWSAGRQASFQREEEVNAKKPREIRQEQQTAFSVFPWRIYLGFLGFLAFINSFSLMRRVPTRDSHMLNPYGTL